MQANEITKLAAEHKKLWYKRNEKFEDWYRILTLDDSDIYQEDMECVISNDPKTFYKRAVKMLSSGITHGIPTDLIAKPELVDTSTIIKFLEMQWHDKSRAYRRRGRLPWMQEFVSFLLATGWYDVLVYGNQSDGLIAEVRNPANCYPKFGSEGEGIVSHFHIYSISAEEATRKCQLHHWPLSREFSKGPVIVYDYWFLDEIGFVNNAIVMRDQVVKDVTKMPFLHIPILSGFATGMPDRGAILKDQQWQSRLGESIIADNEDVYKNYNKQLSFTQQLIRDVAQAKWFERSESDTQILNPDTMYRRGAIFRLGPGDEVGPIGTPALPVEISLHTRNMEDMIQRGSFPYSMFGGLTQQITSYAMNQIASAAQEILSPYADAIKEVIGDIDNIWLNAMRRNKLTIDGWQLPSMFPEFLKAEVDVAINIPGDFIQRATLSRMISPDFRITQKTAMQMLWNEIKDPDKELAGVQAELALQHPVAQAIRLVVGFRNRAGELYEAGDAAGALLFGKAAVAVEATIQTMVTQLGVPTGLTSESPPITPRPEVIPPERTSERELLV